MSLNVLVAYNYVMHASVDMNLYDHGQETSDRHVTGLVWPQSLVQSCIYHYKHTHCMHVRITTILNEYNKIILKGCERAGVG